MDEHSSGGRCPPGRPGRSAAQRRERNGGTLIRSSASSFLAAALERAGAGLSVISVPAPCRSVVTALAAFRRPAASRIIGWMPPEGAGLVGIGAAATLTGPVTSAALRRDANALLASVEATCHPALPPDAPRLLGGFAFGPGASKSDPWTGFGDGLLVLPRWTYRRDGRHARLSLAVAGPLGSAERAAALDELNALLGSLDALPEGAAGGPTAVKRGPPAPAAAWPGETRESWRERVRAILREIEAGAVTKVVAARAVELDMDRGRDPAAVLQELLGRFPQCTAYCLEVDGHVLLGATPERLVRKEGSEVATEALAGSAPPGAGRTLLESGKDRWEHELVLSEIAARLVPLCEEVRPGETRPLELPNISHLRTMVRARARTGTEPLDLVAALHPTPAVAGVPRAAALRWIEEREPIGRGWYAGPFGWLDVGGDGDFVVALRCALLRNERVRLYAGAGIVRGSDPEKEWEETEAKMQPMRDVLSAARGAGRTVPA